MIRILNNMIGQNGFDFLKFKFVVRRYVKIIGKILKLRLNYYKGFIHYSKISYTQQTLDPKHQMNIVTQHKTSTTPKYENRHVIKNHFKLFNL